MGTSKGILIAIEGIDGAGKTTQAKILADALRKAGEAVTASKEPTDGPWGRLIRESAKNGRMTLEDELHAFIEDRKEHIQNVIRPALDRGEIVILDRYFYSTIAYQGSRGAGVPSLIGDMKSTFPIPDIVFLLDLFPSEGLSRIENGRGELPNHFEKCDQLTKIRRIFLELAEDDPGIKMINASQPIDAVFLQIGHTLLDGVLKAKRCAKPYHCDIFYCSYRSNGECSWAKDYPELAKR